MSKIVLVAAAFSVLLLGAHDARALTKWVDTADGSCDDVCAKEGLRPVISGTYTNGKPFYVCSANAENEGWRAGYNLRPTWSSVCVVGWGTKEKAIKPYRCLCD